MVVPLPGIGESQPGGGPVEEGRAQLLFQLLESLA